MNICSNLLLKMMIHFPYGLHCLMRSISALSGFRPRISAFAACPRGYPPPVSILCLYTCRFTGPAEIFSRLYGAGSHANQNHTNGARHIVRFGHKTMPYVRKKFFDVRNGQSRTMRKRKANNPPANSCSLPNRHSAGIQRKMIRANRGRGLESNPGPPVSDMPYRNRLRQTH